MLNAGFKKAGQQVEIWRPKVFFGSLAKSTTRGTGKWLGYIDKWILFPLILRWRLRKKHLRQDSSFHICDHSNSPYLKHLPATRTVITCHDVLAIRGALGYDDAFVGASRAGKILQNWILNNLTSAKKLAAVSYMTFDQLNELDKHNTEQPKNWKVIHNAFNADFHPMPEKNAALLLSKAGVEPGVPFLLHVGSGLPRKNRKLIIDMVAALGEQQSIHICYAGEQVEEALLQYAESKGLKNKIISVVKPDHATLVALYSASEAFIFPSLSEGFGWPVIEAQACGVPVIASSFKPMPEVSGGAALHADPVKPADFAKAFLSLQNKITRDELIKKGFENSLRFDELRMTNAYLELHQS
jgi:glycosyltransferase involved in cell wall biosynthesis